MIKQKVTIEVDSQVYANFRSMLEINCVRAPMILMAAMRSYAEGKIVQNGPYLIGVEEKGKVGRPEGSVKKEPVPIKEDPEVKWGDVPNRTWVPRELAPNDTYFTFDTKGKGDETFEEFYRDVYCDERPKVPNMAHWAEKVKTVLSRSAATFIVKNGWEDSHNFCMADVWETAMIFHEQWDSGLRGAGRLPKEQETT